MELNDVVFKDVSPGTSEEATLAARSGDGPKITGELSECFLILEADDSAIAEDCGCLTKMGFFVYRSRARASKWYRKHKVVVDRVVIAIVFLLILAYILIALIRRFERSYYLLIASGVVVLYWIYAYIRDHYGDSIAGALGPCCCTRRCRAVTRALLVALVALFIAGYTVYVVYRDLRRLYSLAGIAFFLGTAFVFSKHPHKINWNLVFWGVALQYVFGVLILQTEPGFRVFMFLGDQFNAFSSYGNAGIEFVALSLTTQNVFFVNVLFLIFFFASVISALYHIGVMQFVINKLAWCMELAMGASGIECLVAVGNIFVGMTESPLLVKPYIQHMTRSELHSVITSGFATVAGSVLGAYASFGVPVNHLVGASVMSAPAAIALSKMFYPETEKSRAAFLCKNNSKVRKVHANIVEAAASGAIAAVQLVLYITAILIAFTAILAFINVVLSEIGWIVGLEKGFMTVELICSYLFYPLSLMMGVPVKDARVVAELIGLKTFTNEFIAYLKMTDYMEKGVLTDKHSITIATYALCGFSNLSSMGIMIGGLSALAPSRERDISALVIRGLVAGSYSCFMTACIAGLLYAE